MSAPRLLILLPLLALSACSAIPPKEKRDPRDPWEHVNRSTYKFNTVVDHAVVRPVTYGYVKYVPSPLRTGVHNFLTNLTYSDVMISNVLQANFKDAGNDLARIMVNTVFGLGGLLDPATQIGLDRNNQDLGLTLGHYGVPPGPYVVIPILGPSNVRDGTMLAADEYLTPRPYVSLYWGEYVLYVVSAIDLRVQLIPTDATIDAAFDPYVFVRNAYLSHRQFLINPNESSSPELPPDDLGPGNGGKAGAPVPAPISPPPAQNPAPH